MMLKECMGFIRFVALLVNNNYRTIIVITGLLNFAAIHLSTLNKKKKNGTIFVFNHPSKPSLIDCFPYQM